MDFRLSSDFNSSLGDSTEEEVLDISSDREPPVASIPVVHKHFLDTELPGCYVGPAQRDTLLDDKEITKKVNLEQEMAVKPQVSIKETSTGLSATELPDTMSEETKNMLIDKAVTGFEPLSLAKLSENVHNHSLINSDFDCQAKEICSIQTDKSDKSVSKLLHLSKNATFEKEELPSYVSHQHHSELGIENMDISNKDTLYDVIANKDDSVKMENDKEASVQSSVECNDADKVESEYEENSDGDLDFLSNEEGEEDEDDDGENLSFEKTDTFGVLNEKSFCSEEDFSEIVDMKDDTVEKFASDIDKTIKGMYCI